ncbi:hypothetical protein [Desulfobotulus sp.]|uniref:hypothetical protein n=1 Tax=Desulfobotulus sp. TaxID=1940337 RepID=UPI002A35A194|nr:hypothetical protein [Desulfobotulus sp.]MDY0163460.1 hypothetical protein [Desulfobotulus sp.]
MLWEYLILFLLIGWACFYLWRTFFRKKGCSCDSCPSAGNGPCGHNRLGIVLPEEKGCEKEGEKEKEPSQNR